MAWQGAAGPLSKCTELLAFLTSRPNRRVSREELLEALFGGRADNSARAYLRQVIHRLRAALPAEAIHVTADAVRLGDRTPFVSEAARALTALAEAARLRDGERLQATLDALATLDQGDFLEGIEAPLGPSAARGDRRDQDRPAARGRRPRLRPRRLPLARRPGEESLAIDPYRETVWRGRSGSGPRSGTPTRPRRLSTLRRRVARGGASCRPRRPSPRCPSRTRRTHRSPLRPRERSIN